MIVFATAIAFACGLVAGLPQILRMVRQRDSQAQSPVGWAIGAKGAVATAYVGAAKAPGRSSTGPASPAPPSRSSGSPSRSTSRRRD